MVHLALAIAFAEISEYRRTMRCYMCTGSHGAKEMISLFAANAALRYRAMCSPTAVLGSARTRNQPSSTIWPFDTATHNKIVFVLREQRQTLHTLPLMFLYAHVGSDKHKRICNGKIVCTKTHEREKRKRVLKVKD